MPSSRTRTKRRSAFHGRIAISSQVRGTPLPLLSSVRASGDGCFAYWCVVRPNTSKFFPPQCSSSSSSSSSPSSPGKVAAAAKSLLVLFIDHWCLPRPRAGAAREERIDEDAHADFLTSFQVRGVTACALSLSRSYAFSPCDSFAVAVCHFAF